MPEVQVNLTKKQAQAWRSLTSDKDVALLYGGGKGGGKSFLSCLWVTYWVFWLIKFWDLQMSRTPLPVGFFGRKRAVDFDKTTLETFKKVIPYASYSIKEQDREIIFENRAKIYFGGLDDEKNVNKFNSAELAFCAIDQAEETTKQDVSVLQAALRLMHKGKRPPYKELYTANPAECWLKDDFIIGNRVGAIFVPALPDDNPYLPNNYKQTLREAFSHDPALLKAYLEGDWEAFSNYESAVFKPSWFEKSLTVKDESDDEIDPKVVAVDVATKHGQCETVIVYRVGDTIKEIHCYKGLTTTETALTVKKIYEKHDAEICVIDSDGFGEGVADVVQANGINVTEFHGGSSFKAIDQRRFKNLRTQFYILTAKKVERGLLCLNLLPEAIYKKLKSQSCCIGYQPPDPQGRLRIETKEEMMTRGVKSPDLTDALVYSEYGLWACKNADVEPIPWRRKVLC